MLNSLRKNKLIFDTVWFFRRLAGITPASINESFHKKNAPKLVDAYLKQAHIRKLQIGCQNHPMSDWLNVDIYPTLPEIAYMDATQIFPFADNTFDYIFSEHMIEHISFQQGQFMLHECFRVLKPNGGIRIATPNLKFLIELYTPEKTTVQEDYIQFSKRYLKGEPCLDSVIINNFFRDWGHQFIYDEKTLKFSLQNAGFKNVKLCKISESEDSNFKNLEKHGQEITDEFNNLETIVVEGRK